MLVVAEGTNGRQAVELYRQHRPDVVLMDLRMPSMGGVEAIAAIRREFPNARIIVLTTYDGDEDIYRALQAGAQGYLLKDMYCDEILEAIVEVHTGRRHIPGRVATRLAERVFGQDLHGILLPAFSMVEPDSARTVRADEANRLLLNHRRPASLAEATGSAKEQASKALANMPVRFEANRGQADSKFDFILQGNGYSALLNASQALFTFRQDTPLRMKLASARTARGEGVSEL